MKRSTRTMRLTEIANDVPGLIPTRSDTGSGATPLGHHVIDFANILKTLATGKVAKSKLAPEWAREHAASLLSAVTGGQWTQARRLAGKKWNVPSNKCQLCFSEVGTVLHRRHCKQHNLGAGHKLPKRLS